MAAVLRILAGFILAGALVAGCASPPQGVFQPQLDFDSKSKRQLNDLPPPLARVSAAVYNFSDQTGALAPSETFQALSKAITQGGSSMLVRSLQEAGRRSWFTVVEREGLSNLLKERQIIREMRQRYLGETNIDPNALPPLLLAGVLLEGGIVGFDTNTFTGGAGARLLGIGGSIQYRQDTVSVYLRAVSTKTGEVLATVVTHKTIVSTLLQGNAFKFISFDDLLEAEAGVTRNEPRQFAVQQAIDKAVFALIIEGAKLGVWEFADPVTGQQLISEYDNTPRGVWYNDGGKPVYAQSADSGSQRLN